MGPQSAELGHSLLLLLFLGLFFAASRCLWAQEAKDSLDAVASSQVDEAVRAITQNDQRTLTGYGLGFFVRSIAGNDGKQHLMLHHPGDLRVPVTQPCAT
jgi:hypothetical protein